MADRPRLVTDAERAEILRLHGEGVIRNEIAERVGRGPATVSKIVKDAGGSFSRVGEAGRAARHADLAIKRAKLIADTHDRLAETLARTGAQRFDTILKGEGGAEYAQSLSFIPARDLQQMANAASSFAATIERLQKVGQDDGLDQAKSMLGDLTAALVDGYRRADERQGEQ